MKLKEVMPTIELDSERSILVDEKGTKNFELKIELKPGEEYSKDEPFGDYEVVSVYATQNQQRPLPVVNGFIAESIYVIRVTPILD